MTEYKPGTVAALTHRNPGVEEFVAVRGDKAKGWYSARLGYTHESEVAKVRPLVVLDPDNLRACEAEVASPALAAKRLRATNSVVAHVIADQIEAQTKPKTPEPKGLGAVVEGREGNRWVRTNECVGSPWRKVGPVDRVSSWDGISGSYEPVTVLSPGVEE
jgi:hypothetical protein